MQNKDDKTNLFITLLMRVAKGATVCLIALFLIGILDNISQKKKADSKENMLKAGESMAYSNDEKISK